MLPVIGASGLVGLKVARNAADAGMDVAGTYNSRGADPGFPCTKADVADSEGIRRLVAGASPDAVVNASAPRRGLLRAAPGRVGRRQHGGRGAFGARLHRGRRLLNVTHPLTRNALCTMRAQVEREAPELVGGR